MNPAVMQAELALDDILREHDELLDKARGFGMRTAAIPRGLMPLREAQTIVAQFDANTKKLKDFLDSLFTTTRHAPDKATKDALTEISGRAEKALRKFEDDLKKAKEALVRHEDLLVGENFQEMFQALRLAVLDLDLTDKADFTAKTQLYLDANPAYAVGVATVSRTEPKEEVYKVRATYRAETDEYVADMWSKQANRWFPAAKKTGHARIPAFVKAVVDKMKAVHDFEGESLFGSRRTVEDTSPDVVRYRGEVDERKRREMVEKGYQEATRRVTEISQAIDRKLKQRIPTGRTDTHRVARQEHGQNKVVTWNTLTLGATSVQVATTVRVNAFTGAVEPRVTGHYGLISGTSLSNPVAADTSAAYIDAAVDALAKFVLPDPTVVRNLTRKIEGVVSEIRAADPKLNLTPAQDGNGQAEGVVIRKYWAEYPGMQRGYVRLEIKSGARYLDLSVNPLGWDNTDNKFTATPPQAASRILSYLKVPAPVATPAPVVAPAPTPAPPPAAPTPSVGGGGVTPHIRAVLRELRGQKIGYPGTLGAAAETEINKVLTGAAPSITLTASKLVPVADAMQSDVRAVQDLARTVQGQYKSGTAQVGSVTLTQKVTLKYRAQVVNLLLTIPSKDARPPGPTDPSVDLAGSVGEYFARGSRGALPAKITSFIAAVEVTVSRQGGRLASTTRTAGATTFENLVWVADVGAAFRSVHQEELASHGHREGYPGTIAAKSTYTVRANEPMTQSAAFAFARKDIDRNDKWDRDAYAVPVSRGTVLSTDKVTVTVTARDEREALRQAKMRIYATGRFPPNADVVVSDLVAKKTAETPRTKTFEVTGTRKAVLTGKTDGWLFYGWAPE